jgi:hypothetical protein
MSIYCRYWGGCGVSRGWFIGIGGYKKGYLLKIGISFIKKMYWEGGFKKRILGDIYQYLVKLGLFFNIPPTKALCLSFIE